MSTSFTFNYRRRSHSASSPSPSPAPPSAWQPTQKRAHSSHRDSPGFLESSSSQISNVDIWRTGKRRRRDLSPSRASGHLTPSSADSRSTRSASSAPHTPLFPFSPADFLLFPGRSAYKGNAGAQSRSPSSLASSLPDDYSESSESELARLRSEAFWELQRSVEESGEGLVKRMRDFEDSRSKTSQYSRPRGAQRRRRKRHSPSVPTARIMRKRCVSDNDDEDVQILGVDAMSGSMFYPRQKRASSLGAMDIENDYPSQEESNPSSIILSPVSSNASIFSTQSTHRDLTYTSNQNPTTEPDTSFTLSSESTGPAYTDAFTPASFHSLFRRPSVQNDSLSAEEAAARSNALSPCLSSPPTSRTEKAIAALALAMTNGAGGLGDYAAVRNYQASCVEDPLAGELWH
ncbi:hypothetical protein F5I97DRAFT_1581079 [Phlebopus sp. FC_14]|nr:hypothetical protein F5I97DRAFT_1581079 [Phlebopus sp. FC_14]